MLFISIFFFIYTLVLIYYLSALNSLKTALKGCFNVCLYTLIIYLCVNVC